MTDDSRHPRISAIRSTHFTETHAVMVWDDGERLQDITNTADPESVLEFMNTMVDFYEADVDHRDELPLYAEVEDSGFVYIRDPQGGEYVMWAVNEWIAPRPGVDFRAWNRSDEPPLTDDRTGINENVIGAVLNGIRKAYEDPDSIFNQFDRMQVESAQLPAHR